MKDKSWEYYSDRNKLAQEAQSEFSNSVMVQRYMDFMMQLQMEIEYC